MDPQDVIGEASRLNSRPSSLSPRKENLFDKQQQFSPLTKSNSELSLTSSVGARSNRDTVYCKHVLTIEGLRAQLHFNNLEKRNL